MDGQYHFCTFFDDLISCRDEISIVFDWKALDDLVFCRVFDETVKWQANFEIWFESKFKTQQFLNIDLDFSIFFFDLLDKRRLLNDTVNYSRNNWKIKFESSFFFSFDNHIWTHQRLISIEMKWKKDIEWMVGIVQWI